MRDYTCDTCKQPCTKRHFTITVHKYEGEWLVGKFGEVDLCATCFGDHIASVMPKKDLASQVLLIEGDKSSKFGVTSGAKLMVSEEPK